MVLSSEIIERRLRGVDQTSESIQTTSMWIMHHKDSIAEIVKVWNELFKTANDALQIALFYLANDVCQKAKKRDDASVLLNAFAPHWTNAISLVKSLSGNRDNGAVIKAIERILDIFDERQVYSKSQLDDMRSALIGLNDTDDSAFEFETDVLAKVIEAYQRGEMVMERARGILARSDFNFKEKIKSRMKDRQEGEKLLEEIEMAQKKLENFLSTLAKHKTRGTHLMEVLEAGKRFFTLQLRDVTVVEDAYQKFSSGIDSVRSELEEMVKTNIYPGASPPRDAPSPTPNEDPFQAGVETVFERLRRPKENTEVTDMDVDNEDEHSSTIDSHHSRTNMPSIVTTKGISEVTAAVSSLQEAVSLSAAQSNALHLNPRMVSQSQAGLPASVSVPSTLSTSSFPISTVVHSAAASSHTPVISASQKINPSAIVSTVSGIQLPMQTKPNTLSVHPPMVTSTLTLNTETTVLTTLAGTSKSMSHLLQYSPMSMPPSWMTVPPPAFGLPPDFSLPPFSIPTATSVSRLPLPTTATSSSASSDSTGSGALTQSGFGTLTGFPLLTGTSTLGMSTTTSPSSSNGVSSLSGVSFSTIPPPFMPPGTSQPLTSPNASSSFPATSAASLSDTCSKNVCLSTATSINLDVRRNSSSGIPVSGFEDGHRSKHEGFRGYDNFQDHPYDRTMERRYSHGDRGYNHGRNGRRRYSKYEPGSTSGGRDRR